MHPALTKRTRRTSGLGHRVLIERQGGEWHAVLYRRVHGPFGLDLDPIREWRNQSLDSLTETVEREAPGVDALVLVEA